MSERLTNASSSCAADPETRERLLRAAEHLFAARGYRGASVRAIARMARCNVSLVAYYFGSKEGLLREVMRPRIRRLREVIEQMKDSETLTRAHLGAFLESLVAEVQTQQPFFRLMFSELLRQDSPLGTEVLEPVWDNQRAAMEVFQRAVRQGLVRQDLDLRFALTTLFGAIVLPILLPQLARGVLGEHSRDALAGPGVKEVETILFHGILRRDAEEGA